MPMSPVGFWHTGGVAPTVSLNTTNVNNSSDFGPVYANLRYSNTGEEFTNTPAETNNYTSSRGNWLDTGSASAVWFERIINTGSLTTDPGAGRLNMGTTRTISNTDSNDTSIAKAANLDLKMWDAASGGSTLDSILGFTLRAQWFDSCPLCCFTPETPILMADDTHKAIGDVRAGDLVRIQNGIEKVGEIIIRENRPMTKLTFSDGRTLFLSIDHPIYIKGKGAACVNSSTEYKDCGVPNVLEIGDYALIESGLLIKLVGITSYDYPGKVYTLSNSRFFAGGVMVY